MALSTLKDGGLYILLFIRAPEYSPDNFHWALYHHKSAEIGGTKYHVTGSVGAWLADHGTVKDVMKTIFLVGAFHVANVPPGTVDRLEKLIMAEDDSVNSVSDTTCRVWLLRALERTRDEDILRCDDLKALEREVMDWGNSKQVSAIQAEKPRPTGSSKLCKLD